MNNKLFFSLTIVGTVLMLLLLFSELQVVDAEQPAPAQSFADVYQTAINQLKSMADNADSNIASSNLDSKIQALEYKQSVQATAMAEPPKSLEEICNAIQMDESIQTKQFQPDKPAGILEVTEDFLGEEGYLINNIWRGEYNGYETEMYVGNLYADDQKGLLILNIPALSFWHVFYDPDQNGSLRITNVDGYRLQLATIDGNIRYFDIPAQQFTQELTKSLSVVDLPPAPTPIIDPCAQFSNRIEQQEFILLSGIDSVDLHLRKTDCHRAISLRPGKNANSAIRKDWILHTEDEGIISKQAHLTANYPDTQADSLWGSRWYSGWRPILHQGGAAIPNPFRARISLTINQKAIIVIFRNCTHDDAIHILASAQTNVDVCFQVKIPQNVLQFQAKQRCLGLLNCQGDRIIHPGNIAGTERSRAPI